MKIIIVSIIAVFSFVSVCAAEESTVYKKYNKEGVVEFSDVPDTGSKTVPVPPMNTYKQKPLPKQFQKKVEQTDPEKYQRLTFSAPSDDKVVRQNAGDVTVTVTTEPALNAAHTIRFVLDGNEKTAQSSPKTSTIFKNVSRGTHSLQAFIVNKAGKVLLSSAKIKFHLQRISIIPKPKPKPKPKPAP